MEYYDIIYLRQETKELNFLLEYAKAFHEFHKMLDQGFVDCIANVNINAMHYWRFYNSLKDLVKFCDTNKLSHKRFWKYAYEVLLLNGNDSKSFFNIWTLPWMKEAILKKSEENDQIVLAKSYDSYTKNNPYYYIYYNALVLRLKDKYGDDECRSKIKDLTNSEKFDIRVFNDFNIIV